MTTRTSYADRDYERFDDGELGAPIDLSPATKAVIADPNVIEMYTADVDFGPLDGVLSWIGRKFNRRLIPDGTSSPTSVANAIGAKIAILFGLITRRLTDPDGQGMFPAGADGSIGFVAKSDAFGSAPANTGNWYVFGNAAASGSVCALVRRTDNKIGLIWNGAQAGVSAAALAAGSNFFGLVSYEQATRTVNVYVNGALVIGPLVMPAAASNNQLVIGGAQASPGVGGGGSGATPAQDFIGDVIIYSKPLALPAYAASLATFNAYPVSRYGNVFG